GRRSRSRVGLSWLGRIHCQDLFGYGPFKNLSYTVSKLRRGQVRFHVPHRMIPVRVDRPDAALVGLNVRLAPVSTVSNIERQDLVLEMDYASSSLPTVLLSSPAFPFSENDFLPCLARYRVYLRNCLCLDYCLCENLYVS